MLGGMILLISPACAWGWGCEGHQAVALIAEKHMSRHALDEADKLLRSAPVDDAIETRCQERTGDPIVDSASWADDIRKLRPETSSWHYIDIPLATSGGSLQDYCAGGRSCVTSALARQIDVLRSRNGPRADRADALRFVIHLVADLHQPLHCVTNNDLGGNCVPVKYFSEAPIENRADVYSPNLHGIWDYNLIAEYIRWITVPQWANSLDQKYRAQDDGWQRQGVHLDDWAWSSHHLAASTAYGQLPVAIPPQSPRPVLSCSDDGNVSRHMLWLHEQVSETYVDAARPALEEQIAKAGVRLAMILNEIWP